MKTRITAEERLRILQHADSYRNWRTLNDRRVCVFCERDFSGRAVRIEDDGRGRHYLRCPTRGCPGTPREWVYPGNPLMCEKVYADWWRALSAPADGTGSSAMEMDHA